MRRLMIALLCLSGVAYGQAVGGGGVPGAGSTSPFQSLTTTGSSGASTLIGGVLNVPQYAGGTTTNALTLNNSGAGAASGTTFNGASAITLSYNTLGAASSGANSNITSLTGLTTPLSQAQGGTGVGSGAWTPASLAVQPLGTATSGANFNSGANNTLASYWNGSAAANCSAGWFTGVNAGTNPAATFGIVTSGCPSGLTLGLGSNPVAGSGLFTLGGGAKFQSNNYVQGTWSEAIGTAIAAAATIAPTNTQPVTHITGTAATVETITPPTGCPPSSSYACEIKLISDGGFVMGLTGNIAVAKTTVAGEVYIMVYDQNTSKWYPTD